MDPFDITKAAQAYSSLTVVLAGFSFAVLMYVVQSSGRHSHEESLDAEKGLALIALTFLGNVAIGVLWAEISGERSQTMRPEILGFVATLLFANNTPLTFQAVALFVAATGRTHLLRLFRWTYLFTIMMAAVFVIVNVIFIHADIHNITTGASDEPLYAVSSPYAKYFLAFVPIILLLAWLVNLCYNHARAIESFNDNIATPSRMTIRRRVGEAAANTFKGFTYAWLASSLAFVIFFAWVSMQSPQVTLPISWIYVLALFWLLITGWAMVFTPGVNRVTLPVGNVVSGNPAVERTETARSAVPAAHL
jgi:hypothetical protein